MDRIWFNGNFYTEDQAYPECTALYVRNGIIMAMGTDSEILALDKDGTAELTDLEGRFVMPGMIDSHMHLLEFAGQDSLIHLESARSFSDVIEMCSERVSWARENAKWVRAIGFNQDDWDVKVLPTRLDLDKIASDIPITIRRACLHVSVCNTKAMEIMGLISNPPESLKNYDMYEDGTLNGVIREDAQFMIESAMPPLTKEEIKELIIAGTTKAAAQGIVEVQTDDFHSVALGNEELIIEAYKELAESGELPIRIYEQCFLSNKDNLINFLNHGHYTGEEYGLFRIGPLKVVTDGSLGSHSAYMRKPYLNDPEKTGIPYYGSEELYEYFKVAHDHGMQIAVHCIGDASLDDTLNGFERIQWENPRTDCRHGIVHCQIMDNDQLERFRKMNTIGYVQPVFLRYDMNIVEDCVGEELASTSYNWRRFIDKGVHISAGTDCPVEKFDTMPNIEYAVTRTNYENGRSWFPENNVTLKEALSMYTYEGAYASFAERTRGTLTVGKEADMVILDKNIFEVPENDIHTINILETVVKGNTVFKA